MEKKNALTKILAIAGTLLVWFPILAPVLASVAGFVTWGVFQFDFLMPAELFPSILVGWGLLIWAALRVHLHLKLIVWGAGSTVGVGVIGALLARVTGLASGAHEPTGWRVALLASVFVLFWAGIIATGVGGILLLRDLFKRSQT